MVSKITALSDWKEAANRKLERYSDFASMLAYNSLDLLFIKHSFDIKAPEFQRSLITSLLMSGISMEVAGTSRPASGSEHLVSHALDEVCARPQMHGLQVGTAAYLCALLQNNLSTGGLRDILVKTGFLTLSDKIRSRKKSFCGLCVWRRKSNAAFIRFFPNRTAINAPSNLLTAMKFCGS